VFQLPSWEKRRYRQEDSTNHGKGSIGLRVLFASPAAIELDTDPVVNPGGSDPPGVTDILGPLMYTNIDKGSS
jgi:hypothetical protein